MAARRLLPELALDTEFHSIGRASRNWKIFISTWLSALQRGASHLRESISSGNILSSVKRKVCERTNNTLEFRRDLPMNQVSFERVPVNCGPQISCHRIRVMVPPVWSYDQGRRRNSCQHFIRRLSCRSGFMPGFAYPREIPKLHSRIGERGILGFSQLHQLDALQHQP